MSEISLKTNKKISLEKYAGKWVAFYNEKVITWAESLKELMRKVKKMGLEKNLSIFSA
jgi:hypothetical protein